MEDQASTINEKSDREILLTIYGDLQKIKEKLEIQEKKFVTLEDYEGTISDYEKFAESELGINSGTIKNQVSVLRYFLDNVKGSITEDTVTDYLILWNHQKQSNHLKALRRL